MILVSLLAPKLAIVFAGRAGENFGLGALVYLIMPVILSTIGFGVA